MSFQDPSQEGYLSANTAKMAPTIAKQIKLGILNFSDGADLLTRQMLADNPLKGDSDYLVMEQEAMRLLMEATDQKDPGMNDMAPNRGQRRAMRALAAKPLRSCKVDVRQSYRWKHLVAPGDLFLILGRPGAGKSLLAPALCHHMGRGAEMMGRRTTKGACLYIAGEGFADLEGRMQALHQRWGDSDVHVLAQPMDLRNEEVLEQVLAMVQQLQPVLIIVDTLAACMPGLQENDGGEMGRAVAALRRLAEVESRPAIGVVHHTPKSSDTPRGHGILEGALDVILRVEVEQEGNRVLRMSKNRNGPVDQAGLGFAIEVEDVGVDQDGDTIWKPVMVENSMRAKGRLAKVGSLGQIAYAFLADLLATKGEPHKVGLDGPEVMAVPIALWKEACAARQLVAMAEPEDPEQESAWKKAGATLREKRCIGVGGGRVWSLVDRPERRG